MTTTVWFLASFHAHSPAIIKAVSEVQQRSFFSRLPSCFRLSWISLELNNIQSNKPAEQFQLVLQLKLQRLLKPIETNLNNIQKTENPVRQFKNYCSNPYLSFFEKVFSSVHNRSLNISSDFTSQYQPFCDKFCIWKKRYCTEKCLAHKNLLVNVE